MNTDKVHAAISRLNRILPLRSHQLALPVDVARLHQAILRSYVELGRSLKHAEIEKQDGNALQDLEILAANDMIVTGPDGELTGAYPFTMENRVHTVDINGQTLHCMCALDALSAGPMFDMPASVKSVCHVTGEAVVVAMDSDRLINPVDVQDLYFGISWNAADNVCCASSLCTEMVFLKGEQVADKWCSEDPENRECFSLPEAIEFATQFFRPLLQPLPG